ncbi:probable magnesium transporter NIPA8 isoform X3 [Chenopodium quinoa]|uniref:probable magnesium transporter NIPA8 isoform X3 n=1 Tax=Chenopodium quinoa TaxID=63459 RepID=UPI000B76D755|nr:probable magnesium transporter NIPA8 isoform X3 [Chenopodium quinoa]
MGEWVIGAFINLFGSIAINFGTNLLKLGHTERERFLLENKDTSGKALLKPVSHFQTWRVGILFFAFGNCLNFFSFGYAAQSLLAALGSVQFVSNIAFAFFVLNKKISVKVLVATTFIVLGNVFLVAFGNHQSPVYTPEELAEKYSNITFLLYCLTLVIVVAFHHYLYRRGELLATSGHQIKAYWQMLLPFSYAVVSGAVGSCSVLFAKSLSNLLRLAMSSNYHLHSWFTYSMLLLFLSTAGFWIAWTFFSICTGFVYFQEYQVFNTLRTTMFILGMMSVFVGITLLAPDEVKGGEVKDGSLDAITSPSVANDEERLLVTSLEDTQNKEVKPILRIMLTKAVDVMLKAKTTCLLALGMGENSMNASSVFVMPMLSSKLTGFRGGSTADRTKFFLMRGNGWDKIPMDEDKLLETSSLVSQSV